MFVRLYPTEKLLHVPVEARHVDAFKTRVADLKTTTNEKADKMALSRKSLAGPGYIILNILRVMNIIGFLAVITASVVMLVKTSASTHLFFFDALGHVITAASSMFLICSELSLFPRYFDRCWPLLSMRHGFVTLGAAQIVIGITVMGNLNKDAGSEEHLGLAFWRVVISAGILSFILGHMNLIASFVFRDRKAGITAREVRADGAAGYKTPVPGSSTPPAPVLAQSYLGSTPRTPPDNKPSNGFRIFTGSDRRDSLLPSYHTTTASKEAGTSTLSASPTSKYSRATDCPKKPVWGGFLGRRSGRNSLAPPLPVNTYGNRSEMAAHHSPEISGPIGVNPQFAHLVPPPQRPDSALHPSRTGESEAFRWKV